ncbi:MAG: transporter [Sphingomonas bacterium]|uniref:NnrU family protein n=1 Tax=Sphingomonas bacterium TaxID=1895847 RepID=UPI00261C68E6|nr:NnrU family protein [Sphingomonas bacterium]MDB5696314.1 transporter [Sphingomonas bacterium]
MIVAAVAFVGTHFLMSHPLRAGMVRALGERGFLGVYSLVSLATLIWLALAYRAAPMEPLWWAPSDPLSIVATVVMLAASVLLMGSLLGNPALPTGGKAAAVPAEASGVFAITRHPMMWAFALWAAVHLAVYPVAPNAVVTIAIGVLALVGAAMQDRKKARAQPDSWPTWQSRTSFWPFAAIAAGRARFGGFRPHDLAGGVVIWLAATWAHGPLSGWAAGIWRWM